MEQKSFEEIQKKSVESSKNFASKLFSEFKQIYADPETALRDILANKSLNDAMILVIVSMVFRYLIVLLYHVGVANGVGIVDAGLFTSSLFGGMIRVTGGALFYLLGIITLNAYIIPRTAQRKFNALDFNKSIGIVAYGLILIFASEFVSYISGISNIMILEVFAEGLSGLSALIMGLGVLVTTREKVVLREYIAVTVFLFIFIQGYYWL